MKTLTAAMKAHVRQGVTTLCTCFEIVRQDGKSLYFTDHDQAVTVDGQKHFPNFGFQRTSVTISLSLEIDSIDVTGLMMDTNAQAGSLLDLIVTREDIDEGAYDFAVVQVFLVNWMTPDMGKVPLRRGWLGEVESNEDGTYKVEVRGLTQVYAYRIGEAYQPECRADLGDDRCMVALAPPLWAPKNGYRVGDHVVGVISAAGDYVNLPFTNPDFEDSLDSGDPGPAVPGFQTYGDTVTGGWTQQSNWNGVSPHTGSWYIAHTNMAGKQSGSLGLTQDVDLITAGFTTTILDGGECRLVSSVWACTPPGNAHYRFRIYALDTNGAQISTLFDSGLQASANDKMVEIKCANALLPTNTRKLRFDLYANKKVGDTHGVFFDSLTASVNDPTGTLGSLQQYGGVAFECTQTGISGTSAPTWTNSIGDTFTDGTCTWVCVDSPSRVGTVTSSSGRTITPAGIADAANFFDDGILTWETGLNAGRSQEIFTWTGGVLTLIFRPFYPVAADDRFAIYAGCDKLLSTCGTKFSNVINFRGEPDVPGQDRYMQVPDANQ